MTIKAGVDLDKLVAEKVMGWDVHFKVDPQDDPTGSRAGRDHFYDRENRTIYLPGQWTPSTSEEHAFEVVLKMRKDGFSFLLWQPPLYLGNPVKSSYDAAMSFVCGQGPCSRHGNGYENHHGAYDITGETLCLAVCKAALIALKAIPGDTKNEE